MVYSQDFLNNISDNQNTTFFTQAINNRAVKVKFRSFEIPPNGPTPLVDISQTVETNGIGLPESTTTRITLTGKIVRPQTEQPTGSGISHVLKGIKEITDVCASGAMGKFEIVCNESDIIYGLDNCKILSVEFNKTSDNWIQTADYTISIEANRSMVLGYLVKNISDSWSIESLEDYIYSGFDINGISQKQEYHNPNLKPSPATIGAPQPASTQTGGSQGGVSPNVSDAKLSVYNIPRFRVSRTVSAVGIPSGEQTSSTGLYNSAYLNAKKWVDDRLLTTLDSPGPTDGTGLISLKSSSALRGGQLLQNSFLYNHIRTTNFSYSDGKYEVVDNWLALPTGIGFTEDYSIEMSTDDRYIHTVSIKGEIRGLAMYDDNKDIQSNNSFVSGESISGTRINLPVMSGKDGVIPTVPSKVLDSISSNSASVPISKDKYRNALSGWINDVKPYLYRRACVAMSTSDRTAGYVAPYVQGAVVQNPPNNPIYSKHTLLNVIPISTSESHNTRQGIISYSYDFNNKFTIISGVVSENITIDDTGPTDVIGEAFVLGRALGPVLQNLGTKTAARKSVTVEVSVIPPSSLKGFFVQNSDCPLYTGGSIYTTISGIIEGLKPFGDRPTSFFGSSNVMRGGGPMNAQGQAYVSQDNYSWDPTNGRYVRSVSWIYQQCTNARHWLDH